MMFPSLPTLANIVAETKFCFVLEAKMFPYKFRNIFVAETICPSLPHVSNVSSTRNIDFPIKHDRKTAVCNKQSDKKTMRANVFHKNVSQPVNTEKRGETLTGNNATIYHVTLF